MTATSTDVTIATCAKVLRSLLAGRTLTFIAGDCHIDRDMVAAIGDYYTGGDPDRAARMLAALERDVAAGDGQRPVDVDDGRGVSPLQSVARQPPTELPAPEAAGPYIAALPARSLTVDLTYQRDLDQGRAKRMAKAFDVTLLGVLEVSDRGGGAYAVIDGQHRWAAACIVSLETMVVCRVHRGLTIDQEAALFYRIDKSRKVLSGWDRWKARRASGDEVVTSIEACVQSYGLRVHDAPRDGVIRSTVTLERIVKLGDLALLASTLDLLCIAYGTGKDGFDGHLLLGVAIVLAHYDVDDEYVIATLVEALQSCPPRSILGRAQALKEAHRAEMARLVASVIVDRYNAQPGRKLESALIRLPLGSRITDRKSAELARIRRWATRNGHPATITGSTEIPAITMRAYRDHAAQSSSPEEA